MLSKKSAVSHDVSLVRCSGTSNAEPLERFKRRYRHSIARPCNMNPDISLPKLSVLDSEMAYREAGVDLSHRPRVPEAGCSGRAT
jgi:hypothetical protein